MFKLLPQESLSPKHPVAEQFLERNFPKSEVISVSRTGSMTVGNCYQNVRDVIAKNGGAGQLGWVLTWWPDHYVEALHHAVWKKPNGDLEDVTGPAFPKMTENEVHFIRDDSRTLTPYDPKVASTFYQLDSSSVIEEYIDLTVRRMKLQKSITDQILQIPHQVMGGGLALAEPIPPNIQLLVGQAPVIDRKRDALIDRLNRGEFDDSK